KNRLYQLLVFSKEQNVGKKMASRFSCSTRFDSVFQPFRQQVQASNRCRYILADFGQLTSEGSTKCEIPWRRPSDVRYFVCQQCCVLGRQPGDCCFACPGCACKQERLALPH